MTETPTQSRFLKYTMLAVGMAECCLAVWIFYYYYFCMDHAEHLHAAWLVWLGKVPYRDFFEHHNPLFWYFLAPVTAAFYQNALILYVSRILACSFYIFMFVALYKICMEFLKVSKTVFILAIELYFLLYDSTALLFELQPDALMLGCFFMGLRAYFRFIQEKQNGKKKDIRAAYLWFAVSFLILQKIALLIGIIGIHALYLLIRKQINIRALFSELVYPAAVGIVFIYWLYYTQSIDLYILYNYDLNYWMQFFNGTKVLQTWMPTRVLPITAILFLKRFLAERNLYRNFVCLLLFSDVICKMAFGAPYVQYFIFTNLLAALVVADYIVCNISGRLAKLLLTAAIVSGGVLQWKMPHNNIYPEYYRLHSYIMKNSKEDEVILNSVRYFFNIYGHNASYYWFGYGNIAPVAFYLYGVNRYYSFNETVFEHLPRFVFMSHVVNQMIDFKTQTLDDYQTHLRKIWRKLPQQFESEEQFVKRWGRIYLDTADYDFLMRYYTWTPYPPLMIRKDLQAR